MTNWITKTVGDWRTASRQHRDLADLANLPDYLLHDIGLDRGGVPSLARQLRSRANR